MFDEIFWYSKETHPPNPFTPLSSSSSTSARVWVLSSGIIKLTFPSTPVCGRVQCCSVARRRHKIKHTVCIAYIQFLAWIVQFFFAKLHLQCKNWYIYIGILHRRFDDLLEGVFGSLWNKILGKGQQYIYIYTYIYIWNMMKPKNKTTTND